MVASKTPGNITIEGAKFVYRTNFAGEEETFNDKGNRYFNVGIPEHMVEALQADGWNIKFTKGTEEFPAEAYLEVTVGFKYRTPEIVLIQDGKKTVITEELVALLDSTEFENLDIVIRPYVWNSAMGNGVKAYLKTFYAQLPNFDPIQAKYRDLD